ncbi:MAG TPA: MarR family transcriptional regulator [Candidatus Thermoplasmatota archaeon]|nr:MarR family transcriptional regulator [Candidatus Thermoplasmatota archaeon]
MRALLVATVVGLALLGATPAALQLPPVELPGSAPPPPAVAPADVAPPVDEGLLAPADPLRGGIPGGSGGLALPPLETVAATTAVGGALALLGFALYSRLARTELLDHERRDRVFQLVRDRPGISLSDVAQETGLAWGTAVYHLDRLERGGFVASERSGGRRCYFPVGAVPKDARVHLGTLQQETTRSVASFVVERPGATQTELAAALGMSASAASKQVSKLESVGLVRREREWKTVRLHPQPPLAALLTPSAPIAVPA